MDPRLTLWFCETSLTALIKESGGFHPIALGETLCCLVSKICCLSMCPSLLDLFLPFGQVGAGIYGGLESAIRSMQTILSVYGSDPPLCCLKVDMTNAFNECSRFSFLSHCRSNCPDILSWVEWCYCCAGEFQFGSHCINLLQVFSRETL